MPRRVHRLLVTCAGALIVLIALGGTSRATTPAGAKALESRLYAPCCYNGTLDIHESELARSLREEIESRLAQGESSDVIQADFVTRYGDRVLAARSDSPLRAMGIGIAVAAILAAAGLLALVRRWTTRRVRGNGARPAAVSSRPGKKRDDLDDRIDADLAELDVS